MRKFEFCDEWGYGHRGMVFRMWNVTNVSTNLWKNCLWYFIKFQNQSPLKFVVFLEFSSFWLCRVFWNLIDRIESVKFLKIYCFSNCFGFLFVRPSVQRRLESPGSTVLVMVPPSGRWWRKWRSPNIVNTHAHSAAR